MPKAISGAMHDETVNIDGCQCVYCGEFFDGQRACNYDMTCDTVTCPHCGHEMRVYLSIEYTCAPREDNEP